MVRKIIRETCCIHEFDTLFHYTKFHYHLQMGFKPDALWNLCLEYYAVEGYILIFEYKSQKRCSKGGRIVHELGRFRDTLTRNKYCISTEIHTDRYSSDIIF